LQQARSRVTAGGELRHHFTEKKLDNLSAARVFVSTLEMTS
jgi:hypothetical protein